MGGMRAEEQEEATRRAPPCRRSLLTKRRTPPRRHCRRINCRDGRWTCGSADARRDWMVLGKGIGTCMCVSAHIFCRVRQWADGRWTCGSGMHRRDWMVWGKAKGLGHRLKSTNDIRSMVHMSFEGLRARPDHRREDSDDLRRLAALPSPSRFAPPASLYQALPAVRFATPVMRGGHTSATPLPPPMHTS